MAIDVNQTVEHFGGKMALRMIGGQVLYDSLSVSVKFKARSVKGVKAFRITLENDLYTVEFYKVRSGVYSSIAKVDGVYAENLRSVIESNTGLYLKL